MASYKNYKSISAAKKAGSMYYTNKQGKKMLAVTKEQLDAWKEKNKGKYKGSALSAWANSKGKNVSEKSGAAKKTVRPKKRPGSGEPPVAKPGSLAIEKVTVAKLIPANSKKQTPSFRNRPLKIPAAVTNKIKKIDSDIKKVSIGEREAASKRLENTKKKLAELRNKKVDKNPASKIDEILDALTNLGLYVKDLSKGGGVPGVRKRRNKKPTVKFGSGGR